jgi:hypothetical protein
VAAVANAKTAFFMSEALSVTGFRTRWNGNSFARASGAGGAVVKINIDERDASKPSLS